MSGIQAGDVVQLKSGGPKMTVSKLINENKGARCKWFDGAKVNEDYFEIEMLVKTT